MEKDKNNRIKIELEKIISLIQPMEENQLAAMMALLENLAFMKVTLEDLQKTINEEGVVERYQNGQNQFGKKTSSALRSYNTIIKNYAATLKTVLPYVVPVKQQRLKLIVAAHNAENGDTEESGLSNSDRLNDVFQMLRREARLIVSWGSIQKMIDEGLSDEEILQRALDGDIPSPI